jgi:hypothetical protein
MVKGRKVTDKEQKAKLRDSADERRRVFKELCTHVKAGYSMDCFILLSDVAIRTYLKDFPDEFVEEELVKAMREGKVYWEGIGMQQAIGTCLGNSRSWYYNMANRYGWSEKAQIESKNSHEVQVNIVNYATKKRPQVQEREH